MWFKKDYNHMVTISYSVVLIQMVVVVPVKEGGQQATQQHLVLDPGAQVTVHQLTSCHEHLGAWTGETTTKTFSISRSPHWIQWSVGPKG